MRANQNTISVTIGISAYNEEYNIGKLLIGLLKQKQRTMTIEKIIVISDGSTDLTASIVHSIRSDRIHCFTGTKRLGKPTRLNQLFRFVQSDVLVIVDGDMIFKDPWAIERLVKKLTTHTHVGLASGNTQPLAPQTFVESAVSVYFDAKNSVSCAFDFGRTAYSIQGFIAYKKELYKRLVLPDTILNDDAYSFFWCITSGWKHAYAHNAIVYIRPAQTVTDYMHQMTRYIRGGKQIRSFFDPAIVDKVTRIPKPIALKMITYQLIHNPLGYITRKMLTKLCEICVRIPKITYSTQWVMIRTSKLL